MPPAHCLRPIQVIAVSIYRPKLFSSHPSSDREDGPEEKRPEIVAKSALTGSIDHVDLTEHVALGVTVETGIYQRSRRHKPTGRKHS
jgi:hypothetical protein